MPAANIVFSLQMFTHPQRNDNLCFTPKLRENVGCLPATKVLSCLQMFTGLQQIDESRFGLASFCHVSAGELTNRDEYINDLERNYLSQSNAASGVGPS